MIYDCFQFFNELDILKLRLNILDPVVDYFVITESTVTFSGDPKPLYYHENKEMFKEFENKIIHNVITDTPDCNPFERDVYQKNAVKRGLANASDDDIIIFSDLDEIPCPQVIKEIIDNVENEKIFHLAQRQYYFFVNLEESSGKLLSLTGEYDGIKEKKWLGTKVFKKAFINDMEIGKTRFPEMKENGVRVDNGGWHFTYMGGDRNQTVEERVAHKIKSAAHQEFNNEKILSNIYKNIKEKKDIFGRKGLFKRVEIDDTFPQYLRDNLEYYNYLILPKERLIDKVLSILKR